MQFTTDGHTVGFDGTPADGATEIEAHLTEVFGSHMTATYIYNHLIVQEAFASYAGGLAFSSAPATSLAPSVGR